jgi:outer membrane receptor protein involved in Fe transport
MARRIASALLGSISLLALTGPALADSSSIETVVVTASKRPEALKNVPMAITVLGQDTLDRINARSFEDYISTVPGMSLIESSPTHPQLVLRGINAGGVGSTVGTYVDETPYGSSSALANGTDMAPNLDTFDIQRVEVLRGPQGTLYGASTLGGLLKFVTNAPDTSGFEAKVEGGGTTLDNGGNGAFARGMANLPVTDDAAVRIVGFDEYDGGWIDDPGRHLNDTNGVRSFGGRGAVLFRPTNKISIRLNAMMQEIHANNDTAEDVVVVSGKLVPKYGTYEQQRTVNGFSASRYAIYNATIDWDLDWAALTSATSYGSYHDFLFTDATGVYGANVQGFLGVNKFTQEVRLASEPNSGPVDWLVGGYYTHEIADLHQDIVFVPHGTALGFIELDSSYIESAGFANATYHFSPKFDVSLGGRYAHNSQNADEFGLATAAGKSDGSVFTWSAAADYHLDEQTSLYARIAKGYRPGGPNILPIGSTGVPAFFGADSLINYEAGVKSVLLDGRLSLDADVFYIDWSDIQLLTVINNTGVDINGGSARSEGFEWNAQWIPLDNLTLSWGGAYTDASLTSNTPALVGGHTGDPLPWAPKWSSSLDADYRFAPIRGWTPYLGGSWRYIGSRASDFQTVGSQVSLPSYNALDARVGVDWNNWEVELYARNLTSAKGYTAFAATGTSAASGNSATAALIAPRLVGVVLRAKF